MVATGVVRQLFEDLVNSPPGALDRKERGARNRDPASRCKLGRSGACALDAELHQLGDIV